MQVITTETQASDLLAIISVLYLFQSAVIVASICVGISVMRGIYKCDVLTACSFSTSPSIPPAPDATP